MTDLRHQVNALLPLPVEQVIRHYPDLTIFGPGWSLNINGGWNLSVDGAVFADSEDDPDAPMSKLDRLRGRALTECELNDDDMFDPIFWFGAIRLGVMADTEIDPWVLHIDGLPVVLVGCGPASHDDWLGQQRSQQGLPAVRDREGGR